MSKKGGQGFKKSLDIVDVFAYIAIVFAAIIFLINAIMTLVDGNLGHVVNILRIIKDIAVIGALALGGYSFARRRGVVTKIFYWLAIIVYIVCIILGIVYNF